MQGVHGRERMAKQQLLSLDQNGFGNRELPVLAAPVPTEHSPETLKLFARQVAEPHLAVERGSNFHRRQSGNEERVPRGWAADPANLRSARLRAVVAADQR